MVKILVGAVCGGSVKVRWLLPHVVGCSGTCPTSYLWGSLFWSVSWLCVWRFRPGIDGIGASAPLSVLWDRSRFFVPVEFSTLKAIDEVV